MTFSAVLDRWWALVSPYQGSSITPSKDKDFHKITQLPKRASKASVQSLQRPPKRQNHGFPSHISASRKRPRSREWPVLHRANEPEASPRKKVRFDIAQNGIREFHESESCVQHLAQPEKKTTCKNSGLASDAFMSGALPGSSSGPERLLSIPSDAIVCRSNLATAMTKMPFKIVGQQELRELNLFEDGFPEDVIGEGFKTTFLGIRRALVDAKSAHLHDNAESLSYDDILVGALAKRAGVFVRDEKVQYVEDLVPIVGMSDQGFDEEYWAMVWSKSTFWDELAEATKEAIETGRQ